MCGFCSVWVCVGVCLRFVTSGCVYVCVSMCGFCDMLVCVCVGFVMCGCAYVWVFW